MKTIQNIPSSNKRKRYLLELLGEHKVIVPELGFKLYHNTQQPIKEYCYYCKASAMPQLRKDLEELWKEGAICRTLVKDDEKESFFEYEELIVGTRAERISKTALKITDRKARKQFFVYYLAPFEKEANAIFSHYVFSESENCLIFKKENIVNAKRDSREIPKSEFEKYKKISSSMEKDKKVYNEMLERIIDYSYWWDYYCDPRSAAFEIALDWCIGTKKSDEVYDEYFSLQRRIDRDKEYLERRKKYWQDVTFYNLNQFGKEKMLLPYRKIYQDISKFRYYFLRKEKIDLYITDSDIIMFFHDKTFDKYIHIPLFFADKNQYNKKHFILSEKIKRMQHLKKLELEYVSEISRLELKIINVVRENGFCQTHYALERTKPQPWSLYH